MIVLTMGLKELCLTESLEEIEKYIENNHNDILTDITMIILLNRFNFDNCKHLIKQDFIKSIEHVINTKRSNDVIYLIDNDILIDDVLISKTLRSDKNKNKTIIEHIKNVENYHKLYYELTRRDDFDNMNNMINRGYKPEDLSWLLLLRRYPTFESFYLTLSKKDKNSKYFENEYKLKILDIVSFQNIINVSSNEGRYYYLIMYVITKLDILPPFTQGLVNQLLDIDKSVSTKINEEFSKFGKYRPPLGVVLLNKILLKCPIVILTDLIQYMTNVEIQRDNFEIIVKDLDDVKKAIINTYIPQPPPPYQKEKKVWYKNIFN